MSRVDFYILPDGASVDRFACTIANKAWQSGNQVHIHTASEQSSNTIDDLLWIFRDISFVPHQLFDGERDEDTPITIAHNDRYPSDSQVMINLDTSIPDFSNQFERIVEIVGGDENNKRLARQRYREYKSNNHEIHDHKIDKLNDHD